MQVILKKLILLNCSSERKKLWKKDISFEYQKGRDNNACQQNKPSLSYKAAWSVQWLVPRPREKSNNPTRNPLPEQIQLDGFSLYTIPLRHCNIPRKTLPNLSWWQILSEHSCIQLHWQQRCSYINQLVQQNSPRCQNTALNWTEMIKLLISLLPAVTKMNSSHKASWHILGYCGCKVNWNTDMR